MANIIRAIQTVANSQIVDVESFYRSRNRINAVGDALEVFIKDIFADTINEVDEGRKNLAYAKVFSYFGNQTA